LEADNVARIAIFGGLKSKTIRAIVVGAAPLTATGGLALAAQDRAFRTQIGSLWRRK